VEIGHRRKKPDGRKAGEVVMFRKERGGERKIRMYEEGCRYIAWGKTLRETSQFWNIKNVD
jgi:hypothetical protein